MNLLDLINAYRASQPAPQGQAAPMAGQSFLSGLMTGSGAGAPPGFSLPFANAVGGGGNAHYPAYQFGYVGNPASERLGMVPPGGLLPGMAMQLAAAQHPYVPTPVPDPRRPRRGSGGRMGDNRISSPFAWMWGAGDRMGGREAMGGYSGGAGQPGSTGGDYGSGVEEAGGWGGYRDPRDSTNFGH